MTKSPFLMTVFMLVISLSATAQSDQHYTMFMYNKLLYNPGYTGSREITSINATYRRQWTEIPGSPRTFNLTADGPLGTYMRPFRKQAIGLSMSYDRQGVERTMDFRGYYAYRIQLKKSVLSFGLSGGGSSYSAWYNGYLNSYVGGFPTADPAFASEITSTMLPNFGAGVFWSGKSFYAGLSAPNMLQNYYDKDRGRLTAKQIRAYYLCGGYSFTTSDVITIQPQVIARYAMNGLYSLPFNADINLSAIAYDRVLLGLSYRTNGAINGIVHVQVSRRFNMGYAYEHATSAISGYSGGTHEIVLGYDVVRDNFQFLTPRFIRKF